MPRSLRGHTAPYEGIVRRPGTRREEGTGRPRRISTMDQRDASAGISRPCSYLRMTRMPSSPLTTTT